MGGDSKEKLPYEMDYERFYIQKDPLKDWSWRASE